MTFSELYNINYAWKISTQLTVINNTVEKMTASDARKKYGDYTVLMIDGDRVCVSNTEEE